MAMSRSWELIVAAIAVVIGGIASYTFFAQGHATAPGQAYYAEDGVAIRGTDPVAYFVDGAPIAGDSAYALKWNGATWHFASAENRDLFEADPEAYAPQYGGYCAWAVAEKGQLFSTQPENWAIVDGKLYLNYNDSIQDKWDADRAGFIEMGDQSWPKIAPGSAS